MKIKILHISRKHSLSYCKKRGGMFFLERFILIPVYEEILFGRRDQRKRRHFSIFQKEISTTTAWHSRNVDSEQFEPQMGYEPTTLRI